MWFQLTGWLKPFGFGTACFPKWGFWHFVRRSDYKEVKI